MPLPGTKWYTRPAQVPDLEYRQTFSSYQNDDKPANNAAEAAPSTTPSTFDLRALIAEAEQGDSPSPDLKPTYPNPQSPDSKPYNPDSPSLHPKPTEEYDPTAPLLPSLSSRIQASHALRAARASGPKFEHNPHYLSHCISGAPYTQTSCKKCTRTRRCKAHREVFQSMTSVSLCAHVRMNLYWAVNDPVNAKSSWKLVIRDYTVDDKALEEEHGDCIPYRPGERTQVLAERLVEDMQKERLRGNVRRARDEVCGLLGAWERAVGVKREREEKKRREDERRRREEQIAIDKVAKEAGVQSLEDTLRALAGLVEIGKAGIKRTIEEVEEGEIVDEVSKKVKVEVVVDETVSGLEHSSSTRRPDSHEETEEGEVIDTIETVVVEEVIKASIEQEASATHLMTSSPTPSPDSPDSLFGEELSYMEDGEVVEDVSEPQIREPILETTEQLAPTPTRTSSVASSSEPASATEVHEVSEEDTPTPATIVITPPASPSSPSSSSSSSASERNNSEASANTLFGGSPSPRPAPFSPNSSASASTSASAKGTKHVHFDPDIEVQVVSAGVASPRSEESGYESEDRERDYSDVQGQPKTRRSTSLGKGMRAMLEGLEQGSFIDDGSELGEGRRYEPGDGSEDEDGYEVVDQDEDEDEEEEEEDGKQGAGEDYSGFGPFGAFGEVLEDQVDWEDGDIAW
ncbi:hypothetical protein K491DRAFT_758745 [Lophiostoma macrostomum CBS 122681]|uniref:Uncharacterized protein n=1 Tax=Lophiostoma macrostomum CBS 122681 TaxID=1314788 RepID=A0A6A6T517_9PLEO|nr:hypothetical protein K491DRAFT_758745 [Lophiostoma macrostomum CBS 122681]